MTTRPDPPGTHIGSDERLLLHWRRMMGPGGFGARTLWLVFLDADDRTMPVVVPVDDVPAVPDVAMVTKLVRVISTLAPRGEGLSVAALLSRPGPGGGTDTDRAWAALLLRLAREHGVRMWPVHLATSGQVQCIAADDLIVADA